MHLLWELRDISGIKTITFKHEVCSDPQFHPLQMWSWFLFCLWPPVPQGMCTAQDVKRSELKSVWASQSGMYPLDKNTDEPPPN